MNLSSKYPLIFVRRVGSRLGHQGECAVDWSATTGSDGGVVDGPCDLLAEAAGRLNLSAAERPSREAR
jgi:hypothetical protein